MTVAPLVWLLVFDLVVALVYWAIGLMGVTFEGRLLNLMIGLVILINVVIVLFWLLGLLGYAPVMDMPGPRLHTR